MQGYMGLANAAAKSGFMKRSVRGRPVPDRTGGLCWTSELLRAPEAADAHAELAPILGRGLTGIFRKLTATTPLPQDRGDDIFDDGSCARRRAFIASVAATFPGRLRDGQSSPIRQELRFQPGVEARDFPSEDESWAFFLKTSKT